MGAFVVGKATGKAVGHKRMILSERRSRKRVHESAIESKESNRAMDKTLVEQNERCVEVARTVCAETIVAIDPAKPLALTVTRLPFENIIHGENHTELTRLRNDPPPGERENQVRAQVDPEESEHRNAELAEPAWSIRLAVPHLRIANPSGRIDKPQLTDLMRPRRPRSE